MKQAITVSVRIISDCAVRVPRTACLSSGSMPASILRIVSCACATSVLERDVGNIEEVAQVA